MICLILISMNPERLIFGKDETRPIAIPELDHNHILREARYRQVAYEEDDRGAALVGGAVLEGLLDRLLRTFFRSDEKASKVVDELMKSSASPLFSSGTKARLAYACRLVPVDTYEDASNILRIRNRFAHSIDSISFADQSIRDRTMGLSRSRWFTEELPDSWTKVTEDGVEILDDGEGNRVPVVRACFALGVVLVSAAIHGVQVMLSRIPEKLATLYPPEWDKQPPNDRPANEA